MPRVRTCIYGLIMQSPLLNECQFPFHYQQNLSELHEGPSPFLKGLICVGQTHPEYSLFGSTQNPLIMDPNYICKIPSSLPCSVTKSQEQPHYMHRLHAHSREGLLGVSLELCLLLLGTLRLANAFLSSAHLTGWT